MNFLNLSAVMAQTAEVEHHGLFPFSTAMPLVFCILATVFFVFRFAKDKQPFQLIFAIAIPLSVLLVVSDSKFIFYAVGVIEFIAIISAFVTSIVCRKKPDENKSESKTGGNENNEVSGS